MLAHTTTLLALFALVAYAVLRVVYGRFYGEFGLSPEELGLGYAELLAQAALAVAVLLVFQAVIVTFGVIIWIGLLVELLADARRWWATRRGRPAPAREESAISDWVGATFVVAFVVVVLLSLVLGRRAIAGYGLLAIVLASLAVGYVRLLARGVRHTRRGLAGELMLRGRPATAWWRGGAAGIALAIAVLATVTLVVAADDDAATIRDGGPAHFTRLGVRLVSWGAEPATLVWTGPDVGAELRPLENACLMYLGQHDGTLLLYSPHAPAPDTTYRVPSSLAAVRISPHKRCVRASGIPVP